MKASRRMFNLARVQLRQYTPQQSRVVIDFSTIEESKKEDVTRNT
jgi:hypothetical protein